MRIERLSEHIGAEVRGVDIASPIDGGTFSLLRDAFHRHEVPPAGGETEYASLRAAWASLPEERQALIEDLAAEHSIAWSRQQIAPGLMDDQFLEDTPPAPHPLVRTTPETGEKALLVGSYATHVVGWPLEKGRALLAELLEWATQPRFVYRHEWRRHDLVMWDNVGCLHRGRPWDGRHRRVMHRTTLSGAEQHGSNP